MVWFLSALSFGHGPRGRGFEWVSKGMDLHVFFGGGALGVKRDKIGSVKLKKKMGSVWSYRGFRSAGWYSFVRSTIWA